MKSIYVIILVLLTMFVYGQNNKKIGTVIIPPVPVGQSVNFYIMSGNISTAFRIDAKTGVMYINNQSAIDSYSGWKYLLNVRIRYSQNNIILADSFRNIRILNMPNGKVIGTFTASDPDVRDVPLQTLNYYFMSGNYSTAYLINGSTGVISVKNSSAISTWFKTKDFYILNVRVRDSGVPQRDSFANAYIRLVPDGFPRQDVFNCR